MGAAEWFDDDLAGCSSTDRQDLEVLEQQVYATLTDVARAMDQLRPDHSAGGKLSSSSGTASLPQSVYKYAPPPKKEMSFAEYLEGAGGYRY